MRKLLPRPSGDIPVQHLSMPAPPRQTRKRSTSCSASLSGTWQEVHSPHCHRTEFRLALHKLLVTCRSSAFLTSRGSRETEFAALFFFAPLSPLLFGTKAQEPQA